jgi:hypothetical protein
MEDVLQASLFAGGLLVCTLLLLELGRRFGQRRMASHAEEARAGLGPVDGAVFPRFGLIRVDAFNQVLVDVRESMR